MAAQRFPLTNLENLKIISKHYKFAATVFIASAILHLTVLASVLPHAWSSDSANNEGARLGLRFFATSIAHQFYGFLGLTVIMGLLWFSYVSYGQNAPAPGSHSKKNRSDAIIVIAHAIVVIFEASVFWGFLLQIEFLQSPPVLHS